MRINRLAHPARSEAEVRIIVKNFNINLTDVH